MEQQSQRGIKQPRTAAADTSTTQAPPVGGAHAKAIKRRNPPPQPQQKKKSGSSHGVSFQANDSSANTTATAEGHRMSQLLSTFSASEMARYEAYRRCRLPADAVARFVARRLVREEARRIATDVVARRGRVPRAALRDRPLSDLVGDGAAGEIAAVVAALAKAHAQRLVAATRRTRTTTTTTDDDDAPSSPARLRETRARRRASGTDPGLFLQRPPPSSADDAADDDDDARLRADAAAAAESEFDELMKRAKQKTETPEETSVVLVDASGGEAETQEPSTATD